MKQELMPFKFESYEIRAQLDEQKQPWFCANDVCEALELGNPRQALESHVDEEDAHQMDTPTEGGTQSMNFVNESGLYALIFGSRKPEAKRFKRWVTSEVLPAIRKTGGYGQPLGTPEELEALRIFNGHVLGGDLTFHGVLLYAQRTLDQTGIDVLKLTGKSEAYAQGSDPHGVREFLDSWAAEELGLLWTHCRVKDLYAVYKAWRAPAECLTDEAFSSFIERNMAPALTIHWFDTLERGPVLFPPIPRASGKRARIEQITTDCERFAASARLWIKRATV